MLALYFIVKILRQYRLTLLYRMTGYVANKHAGNPQHPAEIFHLRLGLNLTNQ